MGGSGEIMAIVVGGSGEIMAGRGWSHDLVMPNFMYN